MATPYVSTPLPSAQAPVLTHSDPTPRLELIEFLKAAYALAEAQITFDGTAWSCASCGLRNADRVLVTHWTNCPVERVTEAWSAFKRKVAAHA